MIRQRLARHGEESLVQKEAIRGRQRAGENAHAQDDLLKMVIQFLYASALGMA